MATSGNPKSNGAREVLIKMLMDEIEPMPEFAHLTIEQLKTISEQETDKFLAGLWLSGYRITRIVPTGE